MKLAFPVCFGMQCLSLFCSEDEGREVTPKFSLQCALYWSWKGKITNTAQLAKGQEISTLSKQEHIQFSAKKLS